MPWKKATEELTALHAKFVLPFPAEKRKMFGFQVFFVNNNMFTGVYEDGIIMRLPAAEQEKIMAEKDEVVYFEPQGRRMKEYVWLPEPLLSDAAFMNRWLERSYQYTSALPLKEKKEPKKKA